MSGGSGQFANGVQVQRACPGFFGETLVCSCISFYQYTVSSQKICGAFLLAQTVKNLPAMQETCVRSLRREDPLEKSMATHSSNLAWRNPHGQRRLEGYNHGVTESDMTEQLSTAQEMWEFLGNWECPQGKGAGLDGMKTGPV